MNLRAGILGFIVPGLGQIVNRRREEGLIVFGLWLLWIFVSKYLLELQLILVLIGWFVFSGYSALDAFLFNPKKIREEEMQLKEFEEMIEEKEKKEETELSEARESLERNLSRKYSDFKLLEIKKKEGEIKASVVIEGKFYELTVEKDGTIISKN
jgi:hypothetical protein